ncbi:VUT family protein [Sphingopyxis sp.]|uniref:VUT family protein n=1 Tax=Sphingopyxis sp. TaxID=1908224 RepID=UPI0025E67D24|nr:VUT family protein [Sphingopyxis sp.]MBK6413976.1 VUT family protein [Sphingopyxis sp.]
MTFGAGILFFLMSYVIGDVLTEVYGYARARRVIWADFGPLIFMAVMSWVVLAMPPAPDWWCSGTEALTLKAGEASGSGAVCQATYDSVFGSAWRIVLASIVAFWAGEFVNSYVLARMKVATGGRFCGCARSDQRSSARDRQSDLYPIAFLGIWETEQVLLVMATNWAMKVAWEAALTPQLIWSWAR